MKAGAEALRLATRATTDPRRRRDGELVLVDASLTRCAPVLQIAPTLQAALDDWSSLAPRLAAERARLDAVGWPSEAGAEPFDASAALAPLPRAFQFADGSIYRHHAALMYRWRREPIPPRYEEEPLVYQGGSDVFLAPGADIVAADEAHGIDFEAEIAVITTDVPMGIDGDTALDHIALVVLLNDVSLRHLIPPEVARGFGFYQSKPASSLAPVAVTPAALGAHWRGGLLHERVRIARDGRWFGHPHAGRGTVFHFGQVIAHLARTRRLSAGTIVGAGTVSNDEPDCGSACITEARVRQLLAGAPESDLVPYLRDGERVRIEVLDAAGASLFGAIDQRVRVVGR